MVLGLTFVLRWAATGDARVARDDGCESVSAPGARWAGRAYRYRLALRRPYRYRYRRWVRVSCGWMVAEACRGLGWLGFEGSGGASL